MATVEVQLNTPLAENIQNVIQPKLAELGWVTGGADDTALAEYILLMLVNGKTREEIAAELVNDLLNVESEGSGATEFARWLFDQVDILSGRQAAPSQGEASQGMEDGSGGDTAMDAEMGDSVDGQQNGGVPTGPKSMRGLPAKPRDKRMLGQLNKAMDRTHDGSLHRIKGTAGTGRINSHSRESPKWPRGGMNRPGHGNRPPTGPMAMGQMPQNGSPFGAMSPQQQMQLFAMYEEQARMMAQILSPQQQQQIFAGNPAAQNGFSQQQQQAGKSLFDRVDARPQRHHNRRQNNHNSADMDPTSSMEVEPTSSQPSSNTTKSDPAKTPCRFNLSCTQATCPYAHQSPAAPPGTSIDVSDICAFGAACKNKKCTGSHPSPAKRQTHQSEVDCKFYPHCTNPACPFRHGAANQAAGAGGGNALANAAPLGGAAKSAGSGVAAIPCRNGADCSTPGCPFLHSSVPCKFRPCLNPNCTFKHAPGQKQGRFPDKVWVSGQTGGASGAGEDGGENGAEQTAMHVSERRFVVPDEGEEELILPGRGGASDGGLAADAAEGVVT